MKTQKTAQRTMEAKPLTSTPLTLQPIPGMARDWTAVQFACNKTSKAHNSTTVLTKLASNLKILLP